MALDSAALQPIAALIASWGAQSAHLLVSPGSKFSLAAIACTLLIATLFLLSRRSGKREVRLKVILRALFPRRLWRSRSGRADILWSVFNIFIAGLLFGWAVLSAQQVSAFAHSALTTAFGAPSPTILPGWLAAAAVTLALYLAFELAYWVDHYLSHKVPLLWRFHMVHHSAETLSPLTNFRVHPIDSIVFYNIVALFMGLTDGLLSFGFGRVESGFAIGGTNVLLLAAGIVLTHLQHSHLWISFSGRSGRILISPAHHQIHHSADPRHFDKNFGSSLALWDWLFGTLHVPSREKEKLSFGVSTPGYDPHDFVAGLAGPVLAPLRVAPACPAP
jgi:sterol desaturase/sphingolipid hydroxylase (fatty acid hydroxylase superfamily)